MARRAPGAPEWPAFTDIAREAGLVHPAVYGDVDRKRFIIETNGSGVALVDVDNDGWLDALVLSGTRLAADARREATFEGEAPTTRLYRNRRDGTFEDVTDRVGLRRTGWASSVCAGDFDNDGWTDLYVTSFGRNVLYRNAGGRFDDVTEHAGVGGSGRRWGSGCTFIDIDRDGRLDLFVANYLQFDLETAPGPGEGPNCTWKGVPVNCGPKGLPTDTNLLYRNDGNGRFTDVSERSGISAVQGRYSMTAAAADFDGDGWSDIYVASDSTAAILYRNNRDGTFTDVAVRSGAAYSEDGNPQAGMGLAIGDYDNDGRLDILKTHFSDDIPALYRNLGKGLFEDVATSVRLNVENRYVQWGTALTDFDNDGLADVFYVTGHVYPEIERVLERYPHRGPRIVFRNVAGTRFEQVTELSGPGVSTPHSSRGAAFGDVDNDGDVDVLVMNMNEPPSLLRNEYRGGNAWLRVQLEGRASNRSAIGATVIATAEGRRQARAVLSQASYYSHDDLRLHFGLGPATVAQIEVRWPSGRIDRVEGVPLRSTLRIVEGETAAQFKRGGTRGLPEP
ncbi:MAG TPA: CRTAC1 family protein [Vicinamibacterales bacterium]|nr:CRTAC1 family protein [Vicinamibacterales bacterium]